MYIVIISIIRCPHRLLVIIVDTVHFSPSLISIMVSVDVKHHVYLLIAVGTDS